MHLSQWVSETNPGCFLKGFWGVQMDIPSLRIILRSQFLSLLGEVSSMPGNLCPCQKPHIGLCLLHPWPWRGSGACRSSQEWRQDMVSLPSLGSRLCHRCGRVPAPQSGQKGFQDAPCQCPWHGSAYPCPSICPPCLLEAIGCLDAGLPFLHSVSWCFVHLSFSGLLLAAEFPFPNDSIYSQPWGNGNRQTGS